MIILVTMASCVIVGLFGLAIDRWFRSYLTSEHTRQIVSRLYFIRSELDVARHDEYDEQHELSEVRDLVERLGIKLIRYADL